MCFDSFRVTAGPLTPFEVAGAALRVLLALARLHPATAGEERCGAPLFPLPLAHRQMAAPRCLPHIAQVCVCVYAWVSGV